MMGTSRSFESSMFQEVYVATAYCRVFLTGGAQDRSVKVTSIFIFYSRSEPRRLTFS